MFHDTVTGPRQCQGRSFYSTFAVATALIALSFLITPASAFAQAASGYRLQPGDLLQVSVWREEELQREVLIRPDGGISLPLAGDLVASGMTVESLRQEIEKRLRKFIPEAAVSVAVAEARGNVVYVLGKVARPGELPLGRNVDVMQAISMAGGTAMFAKLDEIIVLRRENGTQSTLPFNYKEVERGVQLEQNIILRSGDVVVVP